MCDEASQKFLKHFIIALGTSAQNFVEFSPIFNFLTFFSCGNFSRNFIKYSTHSEKRRKFSFFFANQLPMPNHCLDTLRVTLNPNFSAYATAHEYISAVRFAVPYLSKQNQENFNNGEPSTNKIGRCALIQSFYRIFIELF